MTAQRKPNFTPNNLRTYYDLVSQIEASAGVLTPLIAVCDDFSLRDRIIRQYEQEIQPEMAAYRVKLDMVEPSLTGAIRRLVDSEEALQRVNKAVLTVTGTEKLSFISFKEERTGINKFLGYLQWTRERLREFPYPIVLWITYKILGDLSEKSPDFWSWRKGVFRFERETEIVPAMQHNLNLSADPISEQEDSTFLPIEDLEELIASTEKRNPKDRKLGGLYAKLGRLYSSRIQQGETQDYAKELALASSCFHKAIALQHELGLKADLVDSLIDLGKLHYRQSQNYQAIECFQKSLEIARKIRDRKGESISLIGLGNAYKSLGRYEDAIAFYQQSLAIIREIGDRRGEASSLNNLGNAYNSIGRYEEAIAVYEQSLAIDREIVDRGGEANSLGNLGNAYQSLGRYEEAIAFHEQSVAIFREIGDRGGEASSLGNLGNAYGSLGGYEEAIAFYEQSLAIKRDIGDRGGEANSLNNLGTAYRSLGRYEDAIEYYQQALTIANDLQSSPLKAQIWYNLGNTLSKLDRISDAIGAYRNARQFYQEMQLDHKVQECDKAIGHCQKRDRSFMSQLQ